MRPPEPSDGQWHAYPRVGQQPTLRARTRPPILRSCPVAGTLRGINDSSIPCPDSTPNRPPLPRGRMPLGGTLQADSCACFLGVQELRVISLENTAITVRARALPPQGPGHRFRSATALVERPPHPDDFPFVGEGATRLFDPFRRPVNAAGRDFHTLLHRSYSHGYPQALGPLSLFLSLTFIHGNRSACTWKSPDSPVRTCRRLTKRSGDRLLWR